MTGECGIKDVIGVKGLIEKRLNPVKYLSGSHRSGQSQGHRRSKGCDGYDGDLSFSVCGFVGGVLREEVEYLDMRLRGD